MSSKQKQNLNAFSSFLSQLGQFSPRSQKPNFFLRKAFKESKQGLNEGCQSLWLRLVTDYREAYDKKDFELDEKDQFKIIRVYLNALRSDRVRRKLKEQEVFLRFDWTEAASFAKQAKLFEAEESLRKSEVEAKDIVNYVNDDKRSLSPDRYRDRSVRFEPYSRGREVERNRDRYRNEQSYSRGRDPKYSTRTYRDERSLSRGREDLYKYSYYRRERSPSPSIRYRDRSRDHDEDRNNRSYRSNMNQNGHSQNRFDRVKSLSRERYRTRYREDDNYQGRTSRSQRHFEPNHTNSNQPAYQSGN